MKFFPRGLAAAALAAALGAPALAGTTNGSLGVSATISNDCVFGTSTLAFGAYDPVNANKTTALTASGSVALTCTSGDAITLAGDNGLNHASATGTCATGTCSRAMKAGSDYLGYDLYTSSADTTVWNATNTIPATGTGASQNVSVYGYIPAGSNEPAGSYVDTVTVTATF